jgi:hypothetical protein
MADITLPPRYRAVHAAGGALLYVALGAAWALVGALELRPWGAPWLNIALGAITGALLILGFRGLQRANGLEEDTVSEEQQRERERRARCSHRVISAQGFLITGISAALILSNQHAYIAAATSLAVGLHFVALAAIHRTPGEYLIGGLMIAIAGGAIYWVPQTTALSNGGMNVIAGLGTAAVLWGASIVRLVQINQNWEDPDQGQSQ